MSLSKSNKGWEIWGKIVNFPIKFLPNGASSPKFFFYIFGPVRGIEKVHKSLWNVQPETKNRILKTIEAHSLIVRFNADG